MYNWILITYNSQWKLILDTFWKNVIWKIEFTVILFDVLSINKEADMKDNDIIN